MLDKFEKRLQELFYLVEEVGKDLEVDDNKAIRDIHNDLVALLDVYHAYNNYRNDFSGEESFKKAYNIYRSKRGAVCYED